MILSRSQSEPKYLSKSSYKSAYPPPLHQFPPSPTKQAPPIPLAHPSLYHHSPYHYLIFPLQSSLSLSLNCTQGGNNIKSYT